MTTLRNQSEVVENYPWYGTLINSLDISKAYMILKIDQLTISKLKHEEKKRSRKNHHRMEQSRNDIKWKPEST